jgi:hypothetical protein
VVPMDLHVIGAATDGKLWHTLRLEQPAERSWQPFGDVKRQAQAGNDVGPFIDVDCARELRDVSDSEGILHVVGVTGDGRLWYTARDPALPFGWTRFGPVGLGAGEPRPFLRAAVATARQANRIEVVVAAVTADGVLWATTRKAGSEFHPFKSVAPPAGRGDPTLRAVALADAAGAAVKIHLAAVSGDGHLWHAVGRPQQWPLQDVERTRAGAVPGDLTDVACASAGDLDMVAVAGDGHVWHTTHDASAPDAFTAWTPFTDPEAARDVGTFMRIGVAQIQSGLHICGVTSDGRLWHRLRGAAGDRFGDVKAVIKPSPEVRSFQAVACA